MRPIDAEALIGALEKCGEEKIYPQAIIETIKALPSADRPKGEWVEDLNFVHRAWRCSNCFAITSTKTPFCYECGADMRGADR